MRHIRKQEEPQEFARWKRQNTGAEWGDLDHSLHTPLVEQMVKEEQQGLCCYCERRLKPADRHIEHIQPQSKFQARVFAYDNLLVSCNAVKHCGHFKADWYDASLFVSPLDADCESHFYYSANGRIEAKTPEGRETVERLGLNESKLMNARESVFIVLEILDQNGDAGAREWYRQQCTHSEEALQEFASAVLYYLDNF